MANAHGVAMVESTTSRSSGAVARAAATTRDAARRVLRAHQRVGEGLGEDEAGLGADRRGQRRVIAVVDDGDRAADPVGQPAQVGLGLVVDLPHQHGVRARRHQHVEDERGRLHPRVADQHRAGRLERLQPGDERRRGGGAVAGVEVRQLRPAPSLANRNAALPSCQAMVRAEPSRSSCTVGSSGCRYGQAGAPRVGVERVVQPARRRRPSPRAAAARPGTPPDRATAASALTRALRGTATSRPGPDAATASRTAVDRRVLTRREHEGRGARGRLRCGVARFCTVRPARRTRLSIRRSRPGCGSPVTRR